VPIVVMVSVVY